MKLLHNPEPYICLLKINLTNSKTTKKRLNCCNFLPDNQRRWYILRAMNRTYFTYFTSAKSLRSPVAVYKCYCAVWFVYIWALPSNTRQFVQNRGSVRGKKRMLSEFALQFTQHMGSFLFLFSTERDSSTRGDAATAEGQLGVVKARGLQQWCARGRSE